MACKGKVVASTPLTFYSRAFTLKSSANNLKTLVGTQRW